MNFLGILPSTNKRIKPLVGSITYLARKRNSLPTMPPYITHLHTHVPEKISGEGMSWQLRRSSNYFVLLIWSISTLTPVGFLPVWNWDQTGSKALTASGGLVHRIKKTWWKLDNCGHLLVRLWAFFISLISFRLYKSKTVDLHSFSWFLMCNWTYVSIPPSCHFQKILFSILIFCHYSNLDY